MTIQFGGHHLPSLLPRELFADHPDWFPFRNGERNPRYNLCTSSEGAVVALRTAAHAFFERFPGAGVYHLWADDIRSGGWCECDRCAALLPSDQALRATNVLASVLAEVAPGASIAHLAYHDTIEPPTAVQPAPNVVALYAPAHAPTRLPSMTPPAPATPPATGGPSSVCARRSATPPASTSSSTTATRSCTAGSPP